MSIFQKIKIKLFGKQRWRVVVTGDAKAFDVICYYSHSKPREIDGWAMLDRVNYRRMYLNERITIYRRVK